MVGVVPAETVMLGVLAPEGAGGSEGANGAEGADGSEGWAMCVLELLGVPAGLWVADGVTDEEGVGAADAAGSAAPPSVNVQGTGSLSTSFTLQVPVRAALVFVARRHAAKPLPYTRRQYLTTEATVDPAGAAAPNVSSQ